jgi:hypothetical protein
MAYGAVEIEDKLRLEEKAAAQFMMQLVSFSVLRKITPEPRNPVMTCTKQLR